MSYIRQRTLGRYGKPVQPDIQAYTFPASVGGVNAVESLMLMPPQDCLYTFNLMPSEYGMRLRKGYRQWATGCVESPQRAENVDVHSIIPFESNIQNAANDRLFAVTAEGIWDVTLFNTITPFQEVTFAQTEDPSGYGVWCEFTGDSAGSGLRGHYLFYADGLNGIWQYEEATDAWQQPLSSNGSGDNSAPPAAGSWYYRNSAVADNDVTNINYYLGFSVDDVAFVMVFKQRIWVILEDEDDAWYLPVASVAGELKRFTFGSKMPHGGNLQGLYNWTVDGGDGVDDMLVALSRGGDVIVYQGEDPEITPDGSSVGPWSTRGAWFIGETPQSRRLAIDYGPDLYLLSTFGLTSLSDLLRGQPLTGQTPSRKINRFLRADVEQGKNESAWQLVSHPADGFLQIITPKPAQTPYVQYNMNMQTGAWGFWEGVPIFGGDSWNGDYFMGGPNGVVYINDGTLDGTEILKQNFFQNLNPVVGVGWSIPDPFEFSCDGSQVAETEYKTDLYEPLEVGQTYQVFFRIKPNALVNFFQNVPTVTPGAEWSTPVAGDYVCDGTQVAETAYQTNLSMPLEIGVRYDFVFTMKEWIAGSFWLKADGIKITPEFDGNGQYSVSYTPTSSITTVSLVGSADFNGTFTSVVVAYYDGAGMHSLKVGSTVVLEEKTGSGAFSTVFTATTADTTMALVGDDAFVGTFYDVSLRVQSEVGQAISFRCLTSFQAPTGHSNFTKVGFIRTIGVLAGTAALNVRAVYDYAIEQQVKPPVQVPGVGQNVWDSAVWDTDLWDFSIEGKSFPQGALGLGRTFAVGMSGNASTRINVVAWDVLFQTGGYL